ncbi:MAG: hypothetical protein IPK53_11115 [bacterium]|nr:hypothetical protein [bacterium]
MARYIENLNACTDPVSGDYLWIVDASAGATDKDRRVDVGKFGLLATAQSWTATQTVAPSSSGNKGLIINQPTGTLYTYPALEIQLNGTERIRMSVASNSNEIVLASYDNASSIGPYVAIGRNNNASTPAPGFLQLIDKGAANRYIWPDSSGNLRINTSAPTSTDTGGTVVGTQTSSLDSKFIAGEPLPAEQILSAVQAGAEAVRRFTYRSGAFNGEEFSGVVVDYAPRYGMDRDEDHPAGKSLNAITVIGDLLIAVANLAQRVEALEAAHSI